MNYKNSEKNDGSLPNSVINQINEHAVGGFVVFYFNSLTGRPEQTINFDSPVHALALQKHISDWSEIIHQVNLENSVNAIQQQLDMEFREESEDDEDDPSKE